MALVETIPHAEKQRISGACINSVVELTADCRVASTLIFNLLITQPKIIGHVHSQMKHFICSHYKISKIHLTSLTTLKWLVTRM